MQITHKSLATFLGIALLLQMAFAAQAANYYVDVNGGNDGNTGQSAAAAFKRIQTAINTAAAGDTVYVAAGTYPESLNWANKDLTLQGAGAGQTLVDPSTSSDPGRPCLATSSLTAASHLDGFTFQNGRALDLINRLQHGGGMYNENSSPAITNCTFTRNLAETGGAIYNTGSSPTLTNCTFTGNRAVIYGGGMANIYSSPAITNCAFTGNMVDNYGGAMSNYSASPTLTNCTFSANIAVIYGGAVFNLYSSPAITNCVIWGNAAGYDGNGLFNYDSSPVMTNSDVQDLSNPAPDGSGNFASDPRFVRDPIIAYDANIRIDPVASYFGDLRLQSGSPCIDKGADAVVTAPLDLAGNPRISGAHVDAGAYEYQVDATPPTVTASADRTSLWPPNGKIVPVTISGRATDTGSGVNLNSGIYSIADSYGQAHPGSTFKLNPDGTYSFLIGLPASRDGSDKKGRTYTVTVRVADKVGNIGSATVVITVPHDQGK